MTNGMLGQTREFRAVVENERWMVCLIVFGLFAFVAKISVPDIKLAPTLMVDL
jgi:hypothetical protein